MRVAGRVGATVARGADDSFVHAIHEVDGSLGFVRRTERRCGEEVSGALQAAPRIMPLVRMLRYTRHRQRVQRLHEERTHAADEHRRVGMHPAYRAIVGEPSRSSRLHQLHHSCLTLGAGDTIAQRLAERLAHRAECVSDRLAREFHAFIVPADVRGLITMPVGTLNYVTNTPGSDASMPRWVPRAVLLLWLGYLGTVLVQELWDRLFGFLLLLVIALFIALAIEPGTNRLARRGMRRGTATGLILAGVAAVALGFVAVMGALIADQASELSDNRDAYVVDVVDFLNDTFGTDLDSAEILDSIDDPQGPVREFLNSQADRAVQLGVSAFSTLFQVFSILLFTFYFAADGPRLRRTICSWLRPQRQRVVLDVWELAVDKTGGYLSSRAILAVVSSFLHWIAFQAIGTPAPIALALWVGVV
ncbi:MAG: hypothetical protein RL552_1206, partial [Actinomycetota bacterium]